MSLPYSASPSRDFFTRSASLKPVHPDRNPGVTGNPLPVYLGLISEYFRQPPPSVWDGAYQMKET